MSSLHGSMQTGIWKQAADFDNTAYSSSAGMDNVVFNAAFAMASNMYLAEADAYRHKNVLHFYA